MHIYVPLSLAVNHNHYDQPTDSGIKEYEYKNMWKDKVAEPTKIITVHLSIVFYYVSYYDATAYPLQKDYFCLNEYLHTNCLNI